MATVYVLEEDTIKSSDDILVQFVSKKCFVLCKKNGNEMFKWCDRIHFNAFCTDESLEIPHP